MEQKLINFINSSAKQAVSYVNVNGPNASAIKDLIAEFAKALVGEISLDDRLINRVKNDSSHELVAFLNLVFNRYLLSEFKMFPWTTDEPVIQKLIHRSHFSSKETALTGTIRIYIMQLLTRETDLDLSSFVDFLHRQQFTDMDIVTICASNGAVFYWSDNNYRRQKPKLPTDRELTKFGEFLVPLIKPSSGLFGFGKESGMKDAIDDIILKGSFNDEAPKTSWLIFLLLHYSADSVGNLTDFLWWKDYSGRSMVNVTASISLIDINAQRYESAVIQNLEKGRIELGDKFALFYELNAKLHGKYKSELIAIGEDHLDYYTKTNQPGSYFHEPQAFGTPLIEAYADFLFEQNPQEAEERLVRFFREATFLNHSFFKYVERKLGVKAVPLLIDAALKDPKNSPLSDDSYYYTPLFELLQKYDISPYKDALLKFAIDLAGKRSREIVCKALSKLGEAVIAEARALLMAKTLDERVTGALVLSQIGSDTAEMALNDGVDKEQNDEARDIMLQSLAAKRFGVPHTLPEVKQLINFAEKRKKLNKWNEKWIDETKLPSLYWKDTNERLDGNEVRFLFYRMKRATGLNSDIEARQAINRIDKLNSGEFAKALVTAFQDSNADVKLKYYLTMAALLGDDDMMTNLNALFNKSITDKRMKMAEYVVGALAMVGTDKALRLVETIYRKYATKKPAVSLAARGALDAAASELNITMDELSDRIIPNFDFDGIYKHFTIEDDAYRAFVSADFKLNYFTEDNKIRKSLPSGASKELKGVFKDIEKEINVVIKSQSVRLEKYLVEERRWRSAEWKTFFFENPIMFVYALKLLWGVFDKQGKLVNSFYCSEDTSFYNVMDEEVSLEDDQLIGILHPIHLTVDQLATWKDKLYQLSLVTIFPILDRGVFEIRPEDSDLNSSQAFMGKDIPKGADFVNSYLVKKNWIKSTGDGGRTEFSKLYKDGLVKAYANIDGPSAWYQGGNTPAKMFDVVFLGKNWNDKVLIKDLPPIFYSEVMSDIESMINTK